MRLREAGSLAPLSLAAALGIAAVGNLLFVPDSEAGAPQKLAAEGRPVTNEVVIRNCVSCHTRDPEGRMGRISDMRKTPEGWQASLRRMMSLYGVQLEPEDAREIVRYLATWHGLAPEELEPARFEVERRDVQFVYSDRNTENTCAACHSMGRSITQRRTPEEWDLLVQTHRYLYPLMDGQVLYRGGGESPPVTRAIEHLSAAYPLNTPEWAAWEANLRAPRLEGVWTVTGHDPGHGVFYGTFESRETEGSPEEFTTEIRYRYAVDGREVVRTGQGLVYTGYQWRGRSSTPEGDELREVMMVDRDWTEMTGRWFTGDHDELGVDVTLRRASAGPALAGVYPVRVQAGAGTVEITLHGTGLSPQDLTPERMNLGPGISILAVSVQTPERAVLRLQVAEGAPLGRRDLDVGGHPLRDALTVYDQIDRITVDPTLGSSRVGGIVAPKQYQPFTATGWHNGPDGLPGTEDDLELGQVPVRWSLEEYAATYDDDDVDFVGTIDGNGLFTPAPDGPNPERSGNRNNIGTVWVVATYAGSEATGSTPLTARSLLIVTAPLYLRWEGGRP